MEVERNNFNDGDEQININDHDERKGSFRGESAQFQKGSFCVSAQLMGAVG